MGRWEVSVDIDEKAFDHEVELVKERLRRQGAEVIAAVTRVLKYVEQDRLERINGLGELQMSAVGFEVACGAAATLAQLKRGPR
jgi:hypothetical protein